ncbi:CDP-diacylglycerol--glycerol-3-phosphate 3-phosphatidyltransferase, mitochondrial isoform X2 [Chrysoperla carnea]|nr:CDP-diacylglycerol--glycerol-3-phosphate 3-phosphatidyltransferase, mitochondrial isoform X2 [Chrysoperla carnea]
MILRRALATLVEQSTTDLNKTNYITTDTGCNSITWLNSLAPCFPVNSTCIQIMNTPQHFYNSLVEKCSTATKRITLASLYLGTGPLEKNLVDTILNNRYLKNGTLSVNILLDFSRGSRGDVNSRTILLPLIQQHKNSVNLSLYHTPALRGLYRKILPPRWVELVGLQHMKLYIFDDSLIISGANLSNDYFTNRQDRYYVIEDKKLADFYHELVTSVQEFSLNVDEQNNVGLSKKWSHLPYSGSQEKFVHEASSKIKSLLNRTAEVQKFDNTLSTKDSWIFPLVEMGQLNVHNDSIVTKTFFSRAQPNSTIYLATGYFNLTNDYMQTLIDKRSAQCRVLMAHPKANGFQGAKGPAGGIPAAYSLLAKKFQDRLNGKSDSIRLFEYLRPGWTYHAKGLWYYLPEHKYPVLTFIGSPNFGARSVKRDLETQIVIVTKSDELAQKLHEECSSLYNNSYEADTNRPVPYWVHAVVYLFKNYF